MDILIINFFLLNIIILVKTLFINWNEEKNIIHINTLLILINI